MNDRNNWLEHQDQEPQQQIKQAKAALFRYLREQHPQIGRIDLLYGVYGDVSNIASTDYYNSPDADAKHIEVYDDEIYRLVGDVICCITPDDLEMKSIGEMHIFPHSYTIQVVWEL